jgi:hypothetical protein
MPHHIISQLAFFTLLGASLFAVIRGGLSERLGAILIALSWLAEYSMSFLFQNIFSAEAQEMILLITDAALALGLLVLALRFAKIWLGFAMLMLSGELALHGVAMGDWGFRFKSYILFNNVLSFGLLFLLIIATTLAWRQQSRHTHNVPAL